MGLRPGALLSPFDFAASAAAAAPGVAAPGMAVPVEVEVASAEALDIHELVTVVTEREEISLPISATILGAATALTRTRTRTRT